MPFVILLFLMPLLGAMLCAFMPQRQTDRIAVVSVSGMLLSLIGLLLVRPAGVWHVLPLHWRWLEPWLNSGLFGFLLDPLALLLLLIVVVLGFLVILYGTAYIGTGNREHAGLYHISTANDGTTICSLGDSAGYACSAILDHYRDEFEHFITHGRSMYDGSLTVEDPFAAVGATT